MTIQIREYEKTDVNEAVKIWNQVVEDGIFPGTVIYWHCLR